MIEQARELAQRLRNAEVVLFSKDADTIDALAADAEQYLSDWKACTAMNRELLAEVERLKQEQTLQAITDIGQLQEQAEPYTYASKQATKCAQCGEHKHTPLRIDAMDGYVCLTCIDKKLGSLLGEFGYPEPEQEQAEPYAWELFFTNGKSQGFTHDKGEAHEWGEYAVPVYRSAPKGQTALLRQALETMSDIRYVSDYTHIVALCESIKQHLEDA